MTEPMEPKVTSVAETENYLVEKVEEPDGEVTYHVYVANVSIHFFQEEWDEFLALMKSVAK